MRLKLPDLKLPHLSLPPKLAEDLSNTKGILILACFVLVIGIFIWTVAGSVYFFEVRKDYTACDKAFSFNDLRDSYYRAHPEITWDDLVKLDVKTYINDYEARYCPGGGR